MGNGQSADQNQINQARGERDEARRERDLARWERDQAQARGWMIDCALVLLCSGLSFIGVTVSISSLISNTLLVCLLLIGSFINGILLVFTPGIILLIYFCDVTLISVVTNTLLSILLIGSGYRIHVNIQRVLLLHSSGLARETRDQIKKALRKRYQAWKGKDLVQVQESSGIEQAQCVVCLDSPRGVLLRPCRHVCGCQECINRYICLG